MSGDADYVGKNISEQPEAVLAWTYLLWLMAVFRTGGLRGVRSIEAARAYRYGIHLPGCDMLKAAKLDAPSCQWLEYHAAESNLLALWRDLHQAVLGMIHGKDVR